MRGWPLRQKDGQSIWEDLARLTSSPQNTPPTKIANTSAKRPTKKVQIHYSLYAFAYYLVHTLFRLFRTQKLPKDVFFI